MCVRERETERERERECVCVCVSQHSGCTLLANLLLNAAGAHIYMYVCVCVREREREREREQPLHSACQPAVERRRCAREEGQVGGKGVGSGLGERVKGAWRGAPRDLFYFLNVCCVSFFGLCPFLCVLCEFL